MSELVTLARPYAEAAFSRAKETDTIAVWSEVLAFLTGLMADAGILAIVDNPKVPHERIEALMLDICQGQLQQETENFLKLLLQNKRLAAVNEIAKLFEQLKAEHEGYIDVDVLTAFAFSEQEQKKFTATLETKLQRKIRANVVVDKSILGGVIVRAGDKVIDGSVRGRLQSMQKALQ